MSLNYYYLIASLPMLKPYNANRMNSETFLQLCAEQAPPHEMDMLRKCSLENFSDVSFHPTFFQWQKRERETRNQLVVLRAKRADLDAREFLQRKTGGVFVSRTAKEIFEEPSPLKAENMLDRLRWSVLEELETGHYFDLNTLIIYYLKLQLIEKRALIDTERGQTVLESILTRENIVQI